MGRESFAVLPHVEQYPPAKSVYVLYLPSDREFVESQGLKVVYQDEPSGGAVAIRPEILPPAAQLFQVLHHADQRRDQGYHK